jgi:hypothetical protein
MGTPAKVAELSASSLSLIAQLGPIGPQAKKYRWSSKWFIPPIWHGMVQLTDNPNAHAI